MAGFGGSVKLTGESEYRKALSQISQSLRVVSSEMKAVSSAYSTNDADTKSLANQSKQLSTALNQQKTALQSLKSQLTSMEAEYKKTQASHNALVADYDKEKAKLIEIGKTLGTSSTEYKNQQKVVQELESQVQESTKAYDSQTKAINNMRIQTANAETTVNNTAKALDKLGNETDDAADAAKKAGDGFTVFKGILSNLASQAIAKAIEGVKKLGTAVVNVGKQAVASQAEYEQLVGGVETLFKNSAKEVQHYADIAYKTAGMSANQYMETVTSFSASLLQGLGGDTAKAAKIADMAIIDMSDNANKMGTSMEMIQNAYQGFAKQNFTMLDNLKLGYGGTQAEMARLINETGVMGKAFKATAQNVKEVPFDKMIEAIHKVQQNMGITGTTAKEASETISGSVASMKSAWQNLLTGIANSQLDRKQLVKNFTDSIKTAAKNLIPTIKQTIKGLVETAEDLLNTLMGKDMFHFDGDAFVKGIEDAVKKVITVFKWFIDNRDIVIAAIKGMLAAFVVTKITGFVTSVVSAVSTLKTMVTAAQGATSAMKIFNATMAANPIALVTGLVAGLGVALFSIVSSANSANDSLDDTKKRMAQIKEEIDASKQSWDELKKAQKERLDVGMTEITNYQALYKELESIVDANGRVKKGYEGRAAFITSTLSKALGTEIKLQDGVIQKYNEIRGSIEKLIKSKQAELILESQQPAYTEALNNRQAAYGRLQELQGQLTNATNEEMAAQKEYQESLNSWNIFWQMAAQNRYDTALKETANLKQQYDTQAGLVNEYAYNVATYEDNMAKFHEGKYDEMNTATWDYVKQFQSAGDSQKAMLEDQKKTTEYALNYNKQMYEKTGDEIYNTTAKSYQKQLDSLNEQLKQYNSATGTSLNTNEVLWREGLDKTLSEITGSNIEFKDAGDGNVQMYVDGVATGEKKSKDEMAKIVTASINEIAKKSPDADKAGQNLIAGVNSGIINKNQQNAVFRNIANFGNSLLETLKRNTFRENSPSKATKEMGIFLLQGLSVGIKSEEKSVIDQVQDFGDSVMEALNGSLSDGVEFNALDGLKTAVPSDFGVNVGANSSLLAEQAQIANNSLISSFKQALSEMKIEMDDQEMGRFVDNTVTRLVYN